MAADVGLTEKDKERLGELARLSHPAQGPPIPDPTNLSPNWEGNDPKPPESVGEAIVEFAESHTNAKAARHFGVSERTVERHRAGEVEYEGIAHITEAHCSVMRSMAADGFSLSDIAGKFDYSIGAVHRHVSDQAECQHETPASRVDLSDRENRTDIDQQRDTEGGVGF